MDCPCNQPQPSCPMPGVIEVEKPIMFRLVKVPSSVGDETAFPPNPGLYRNVLLHYDINEHTYIYSSDGMPVLLTVEGESGGTYYAGTGLELNDNTFSVDNTIATKSEIPTTFQTIFYMNASETGGTRHIYKKSDMTDPATSKDVFDANDKGQVILRISTSVTPEMYSDAYLQNAYSATGDYQLLFLDEKTYRSFDTSNLTDSTFIYSSRVIQDKLTPGTNIQINGATISATDTTYSDFSGATSGAAGTHGLVPAPASGETDKYLKSDGSWATVSQYTLPAASANTLGGVKIGSNLSMDANDVLSATDTTYSNFVGTDGQTAGTAGLVPAPATTDAGKVLSADGAWTGLPEGVKTLTTADYDYPTDNPTAVATWKLEKGIYLKPAGILARRYAGSSSSSLMTTDNDVIIIAGGATYSSGDKHYAEYIALGDRTSAPDYRVVNYDSGSAQSLANFTYYNTSQLLTSDRVVNQLLTTSEGYVLDARQGKVLNERIGDLSTLTTTAKTSAVAAINELDSEIPVITMTSTDPGEGSPLAANNFIAYYE